MTTPQPPSLLSERDDLDVLRYVDGEMTEEQAIAFEERLATEPQLAEAVEGAWRMDEVLGRALVEPKQGRGWSQGGATAAIFLAAAAALLLVIQPSGGHSAPLRLETRWFDPSDHAFPPIPAVTTRSPEDWEDVDLAAWVTDEYAPAEVVALEATLAGEGVGVEIAESTGFLALEITRPLDLIVVAELETGAWQRVFPFEPHYQPVDVSHLSAGRHLLPEPTVIPYVDYLSRREGWGRRPKAWRRIALAHRSGLIDEAALEVIDSIVEASGDVEELRTALATQGFALDVVD